VVGFAVVSAAWAAVADGGAPDYKALRAQRADGLTRPDGWFSLVALEWLKDGDTTVGSAAGNALVLEHVPAHLLTLHKADGEVTVETVAPGLTLAGQTVSDGALMSADEDEAHALRSGDVQMWVIDRGGQRYLRVKDPMAKERLHFHGLRWYAPQPAYRVTAKWVPFTGGHTLAVTNKLGQVSKEPVPGYAEFTLGGKTETLTPMVEDGSLFFVFRDTTGRLETDGGGRFLSATQPSHGMSQPGTVVVDFNEAVNPPCAYSPFATCPLAPKENRLAVAVPAGEKRYGE
jgi:uncharacterized protein (DUF1684 family)